MFQLSCFLSFGLFYFFGCFLVLFFFVVFWLSCLLFFGFWFCFLVLFFVFWFCFLFFFGCFLVSFFKVLFNGIQFKYRIVFICQQNNFKRKTTTSQGKTSNLDHPDHPSEMCTSVCWASRNLTEGWMQERNPLKENPWKSGRCQVIYMYWFLVLFFFQEVF